MAKRSASNMGGEAPAANQPEGSRRATKRQRTSGTEGIRRSQRLRDRTVPSASETSRINVNTDVNQTNKDNDPTATAMGNINTTAGNINREMDDNNTAAENSSAAMAGQLNTNVEKSDSIIGFDDISIERCYINRMPKEILISIFQETQKLYQDSHSPLAPSVESVLSLSHVCRTWRNIMINCPPLLMLSCLFDDRRSKSPEGDGADLLYTTPKTVSKVSETYNVNSLLIAVFAGGSREIFDFSMDNRRLRRAELEIRDLYITGLNHHSAEFILKSKFNGLRTVTIVHTDLDRVCQIMSITKTPIFCEELRVISPPVRNRGKLATHQEIKTLTHRFYTTKLFIHVDEDRNQLPDRHVIKRRICQPVGFEVRKFKSSPPPLRSLVLAGLEAHEINEFALRVESLRELTVSLRPLNLCEKGWRSSMERTFWHGLILAGNNLEKVSIRGLNDMEYISGLPEALKKLSPECELTLGGVPGTMVFRELRKKVFPMHILRVHWLLEKPGTPTSEE